MKDTITIDGVTYRKEPAPAPSRSTVTRANGVQLRRMTIYLPPEMGKRLEMASVQRERDMSAIIAEALAIHLPPLPF
jgi:hypothetical protein